ncbi:hypothetical protein SAMN04515671_1764 [Nakamurella panacisegetis]|uniref:Alpha-2-macroglobulin family N-terminal region n=1 Tax=Nakamurella panacisegetis TaxID=1090615 RepID=A0A1H0LR95_9ACTN|nr:Ig-like domain-containing alpha-2-macroglobulin family protein [Nakamurella panacisegetis]SDO70561.1 hypothetical protein SAMN04515671_1764 [Nakamurella panacisegetis]
MTEQARAPRRQARRRVGIAAALAIALVGAVVWISGDGHSPSSAPPGATSTPGANTSDAGPAGGGPATPGNPPGAVAQPAGLRLSAGKGQQPAAPVAVVNGDPLTGPQISAVIDRLPSWTGTSGLAQPFRWPPQSLKKPQAGDEVGLAFPGISKPTPQPSVAGPLHVLRMQPQGAVSVAPFASITFDQPMVAVTTVGQLSATDVPATITPKLAGTWQWIGTSTLRFTADSDQVDRLPMATTFTVTVPAGTRSTTGGTLAEAAKATFSTPAPTVTSFTPSGKSLTLQPVFVAVFDQRVDPAAVLAHVSLRVDGDSWPVRAATAAEVAADTGAASAVSAAVAGRTVAFRPAKALPTDAALSIGFGAGTPSAEGPLTTAKDRTFTGQTYTALTLGSSNCDYGNGVCQPGSSFNLTFTNALDAKAFDPTSVRISPAIPGGATVSASGNAIVVSGSTQPDTTYTVTVPAGLTDTFGQHLARPAVATFVIGAASTRLDPFPQPVTTVDPMVTPSSISVNTVNRKEFRERVFRVSVADWSAFQRLYLATAQLENPRTVPNVPDWPVLVDRVVSVGGAKNRLVSTKLDLSQALSGSGATGHVVVLIEPTESESFDSNTLWQNRPTMTWAQSTTLGLDALNDSATLRAWVTDLRDGRPQAGVTVGPIGDNGQVDPTDSATTAADGVATLPLLAGGASALLATAGKQTAILPSSMGQKGWMKQPGRDQLLWFVTDDRQTYRPGETVSVKGWVRRQGGDVAAALTAAGAQSVDYTVRDAYGVVIGHGTSKVSRLGGFDLTATIPSGANLGTASVELTAAGVATQDGNDFSHPFDIADFRTPAFQVDTHADSSGPHVVGDNLTVATDATYYAGGPLADASVKWQVRTASATYSPPGWDNFTFGRWTPWWTDAAVSSTGGMESSAPTASSMGGKPISEPCCAPVDPNATKFDTFSGVTDSDGHHYLQVKVGDLGADYAGLPVTLTAQATVTDVSRQAIAGTADLLVHPADYYVGLSSADTFVTAGQDLVLQTVTTDIDGAAVPGRAVTVTAAKVATSYVNGRSVDTESDVRTCPVTSTSTPTNCTFHPTASGTYKITATVVDDKGRTSRSELTRWVAGSDGAVDSSVEQQQLTLVPDAKEYQPGQSAKVLVQSPITTGSGLLTVLHNGIVSTSRFAVANGSAVVGVPVTAAEIPGVSVSIEVVGTAARSATDSTPRPAYATGEIGLTVSTLARTLKVTAVPRQRTVTPGGSTSVDVTVTDQTGKPMAASEFELVVADEAVLAVGGDVLPNPMDAFYPELPDGLTAQYGRSLVALADPPVMDSQGGRVPASPELSSAASTPAPGSKTYSTAASGAGSTQRSAGTSNAPIAQRQNFDALALFVPSATTDANGKATIAVKLPDNLTRYRVMVVAVAGADTFGSADSTITAGLPLTVRPSAPRFLNFGDVVELPVLLQNQTDAPLTTDVVLQTVNLKVTGSAGQRVTVPANGRLEVQFPVAADQAGTAKFRVAAVSGTDADAASIELPVYTPATTESFATYGVIGSGQSLLQRVTAPKGVVSQFGGLQISTSSTALQQLSDAVGYIADYDYASSDAYAGQIIAIGSLGDVLTAFSAPGLPSAAELTSLVSADVRKLLALQNDDGGFPYWTRGDPSDPFNSIQSTQALLVAARRGFDVSSKALAKAQQYLDDIASHLPADTSPATRDTLTAYALNVGMLGGHRDAAAAESMVASRGSALTLDAVAWLLPVVSDGGSRSALQRRIDNAAVDDAGSVTFTNQVTDDAWTTLQSDRRTDGLILDALISVTPKSDLIPKVVAGLMGGQTDGRWSNLQENAFILLALRHYYDAFEGTSPDFVAGVWLGDKFAGQHTFAGHTTERANVTVPTSVLLSASNDDVTLQNSGTGRLYYRIGLQTAPSDLKPAPLDRGFVVSRTYTGIDHASDVTRDAAGTWHIKPGAKVKVQLTMVSRSARTYVSLIDPLPAGLEALNADLATTPKSLDPKAAADAYTTRWSGTWYDHQNLRDDRAEAFATYLNGGVYQYSYTTQATTSGTFVVPPPRAEQIYTPETFGRGAGERVVIG